MAQNWDYNTKSNGIAGNFNSSNFTMVLPVSVTVGQTIIALFSHSYTGCPITVTDDLGNTYTKRSANIGVSSHTQWVFTAPVTTGGTCTLSVNRACGNTQVSWAIEVANIASGNPFDGENVKSNASSPCDTAGFTTTADDDLIVGQFLSDALPTITASSGTTILTDSAGRILTIENGATAGTQNPTCTSSGGFPVYGEGSGFKQTAGGAAVSKRLTLLGAGT